jgi:hypothetical protein
VGLPNKGRKIMQKLTREDTVRDTMRELSQAEMDYVAGGYYDNIVLVPNNNNNSQPNNNSQTNFAAIVTSR